MVIEVVRGDTVSVAYRALLRNLRLLGGQRPGKALAGGPTTCRAVVTGYDAAAVAARLAAMEPTCTFEVAGDSASADVAKIRTLKGQRLDSVIISQPYHTLGSRDDFRDLHACLDPEEGTAGFLWVRPASLEDWVKAYHEAAAKASSAASSSSSSSPSLPALRAGQSILEYFDDLDLGSFKFRPVKHRKFVDRLEDGSVGPVLLPYARTISDLRIAARGSAAADAAARAGEQAVLALPGKGAEGGKAILSLDIHTLHTSVVPPLK